MLNLSLDQCDFVKHSLDFHILFLRHCLFMRNSMMELARVSLKSILLDKDFFINWGPLASCVVEVALHFRLL